MNMPFLVLIIGLVLFLPFSALPQSNWSIDKEKAGISVYTRTKKDSDFNAFKALVSLNATNKELIEILKDADNYSAWFGYTRTSKCLEKKRNIQYIYVETIFPWPYSNRDMVYKMSIDSINSNEILILLEGIPAFLPERKGIVRMPKAGGFIRLTSLGAQTRIVYQFHSEPGGDIPVWLANNSIAELPYKTLKGLRAQVMNKPTVK